MSKIKKEWQGWNSHRYYSNTLEESFALAWQELNDRDNMNNMKTIEWILLPAWIKSPTLCSLRDQKVANSIVQWLGSPVGQHFLEEVLNGLCWK